MCKIEDIQRILKVFQLGIRSLSGREMQAVCACLLFASVAAAAPAIMLAPQDQTSTQSQAPQKPGQNKPVQVPEQTPEAGAPVDSNTYKIGPADVLNVRVWHEQEFSGLVTVHEDGKITLPLVGDLQAAGLTPVQIEQVITKALTRYVMKPLVTVTVQEVLSKKYYLDGEVTHPGEYPLVAPTTVFEAISKAGGLAEFANGKKIYVLRGDKRIPFNYKEVSHGKHMEQNIQLQPGDHIVVP